jgi:PAS domain S-box-containing protein
MTEDIFCISDSQGQLTQVNTAWKNVFGDEPTKHVQTNFIQIIHPDDHDKAKKALQGAGSGQATKGLEIKCLDASKKILWLSVCFSPKANSSNIFFVARNITKEKEQQLVSEKTDRLLRQTIDTLPILIGYIDTENNYKLMNAAYKKWIGNFAQSLISGDLEKAVGAESAQKLRKNRKESIETGELRHFEMTFTGVQGDTRYLDVQYHPDFNQSGQVEGLMILGFDLTEINNNHHALINAEKKLQRVLEDAKVGVWERVLSPDIMTTSPNIRQWLGIAMDKQLTWPIFVSTIHPEDRSKVIDAQLLLLQTGQPFQIEFRFRKYGMNDIWIYATANPIHDSNQTIVGGMGILIDISPRKEMEQILLSQQAKMVNASRLSALGEMAGGVAHEINTPLAIILAYADSLQEAATRGNITPEIIEHATGKIQATVTRIAKIIKSLRTLTRDSEKDPLELITVKKMIEDTLEFCQQRFADNNIQLNIEYPINDLCVFTRPTQISQVLLNLLNNAYDAVEKLDTHWVRVTTSDHGDRIEIAVTDSGKGIDPKLSEKIFDPFFTTKGPTKGTGLGLSVSRSLIESHGGMLSLNLNSTNTEFVITLPKNIKI